MSAYLHGRVIHVADTADVNYRAIFHGTSTTIGTHALQRLGAHYEKPQSWQDIQHEWRYQNIHCPVFFRAITSPHEILY